MKANIAKSLKNAIEKFGEDYPEKPNLKEEQIESMIEIPPNSDLGDYAFPCFSLSKTFKISPMDIARSLSVNLNKNSGDFEIIQAQGPYVNFFVNRKNLAQNLLLKIFDENENFGKAQKKDQTVLVEFSSPNIAKPFGIGHLRSTIIGNSVAKISEFNGFKVVKLNYLGDWGTQFGKLILGYKKFGNEKKLKKDPIKHLLELYVKISKSKKYDEEARYWFNQLEQGNKEATALWKKFKDLSLKDFEKIYSLLGINFDVFSGESMYEEEMQNVIKKLKEKDLLVESDGAQIVNLEKFNLGIALITKSDGSTLYMTRDLAAAISRKEKYNFDYMFYEVGQEQKLHLSQVFKILELMGYDWAKNCRHIDHGLYLDKDGKKFATRKGKTIFMEDIINETKKIAIKEIKKRDKKVSKKKLEERSMKVTLAAIFYGDLKNNRKSDMVFDLKRFVSLEGDTGPYLMYSYARAKSILRKSKSKNKVKSFKVGDMHEKEFELINILSKFQENVEKSYEDLNPSYVANYSYKLAKAFNEFYQSCPVIGSEEENFRIVLVEAFSIVLKNSLNLLGIETLEEM